MHNPYKNVTPLRNRRSKNRGGMVTLVGAGSGSLDHLTLGAVKAIAAAEVVLYDALISPEVLATIPAHATAIYTGKRCGQHALTQEAINDLLLKWGRAGYLVVRLKAGDPFVFGRGSEEIATLRSAGIPYRVLPGMSALNAVAANFSLPLTMRGAANEFRAIQGHHLPDDDDYWRDLARYRGMLAIFMGSQRWQEIAKRLLSHGQAAATPFAMIETASDGRQVLQRGTIAEAASQHFARLTSGPAIIYVGANIEFMDISTTQCDLTGCSSINNVSKESQSTKNLTYSKGAKNVVSTTHIS